MIDNESQGFFVAVDGPNGAGKSTLIEKIKDKIQEKGYEVYITREPTDTELGEFIRNYSENKSGISLACLIAADRYVHMQEELIPELKKGKLVITDRYILSSLILQGMDGVSDEFIISLHSNIVKPDLQLAVVANENILQSRLAERDILTRFEKGNQSATELFYMDKGIKVLQGKNVDIMYVDNSSKLEDNVEKIISYILRSWEKNEKICID